ncbi:MAG: sugar-transfer associated ATP-grasp domain-containing protein [Clostridiales bacterium]|nr:sugar-transfer associated ATP-grasp domain-containing protein [Clostridiales bacterium]
MRRLELSYLLRVFKKASFEKMNHCVDLVHQRSGKSKLSIKIDMIKCMKKYGAGYHDYVIFQFYNLSPAERDTFMTRFRFKKFVLHLNDESYAHIFDNKNEFNEIFKDYVRRDTVDLVNDSDQDIKEFLGRNEKIFAKMLDLECSIGVELLNRNDFQTPDDFVNYVRSKKFGVLEEVIENHEDLKTIYPLALNTMRMITLIDDQGNPNLFFAAQKFGMDGRIVDVYGMHSPIDLDEGIIKVPFHSGDTTSEIFYTEHPYTHKSLENIKIPYFQEAKDMILKAATVVPEMRFIGWDVAITPKGPLIIEGNNYGAYEYMQLPGQRKGNTGIIPNVLKLVPSYKYK